MNRMAIQLGAVADPDDVEAIEATRRITHDRLVDNLGSRRRSGISWREVEGDAARSVLAKVEEFGTHEAYGGGDGSYEGLDAFLRDNPRAVLVIAECEADLGT